MYYEQITQEQKKIAHTGIEEFKTKMNICAYV